MKKRAVFQRGSRIKTASEIYEEFRSSVEGMGCAESPPGWVRDCLRDLKRMKDEEEQKGRER